jgi:hypothetical protein
LLKFRNIRVHLRLSAVPFANFRKGETPVLDLELLGKKALF